VIVPFSVLPLASSPLSHDRSISMLSYTGRLAGYVIGSAEATEQSGCDSVSSSTTGAHHNSPPQGRPQSSPRLADTAESRGNHRYDRVRGHRFCENLGGTHAPTRRARRLLHPGWLAVAHVFVALRQRGEPGAGSDFRRLSLSRICGRGRPLGVSRVQAEAAQPQLGRMYAGRHPRL
jgi:hypothetical protein